MTRHDKLVETLAARTSTAAYAKMSFAAWNSNWSPSFPSLPTSLRFCSEGSFDQSISASAHKCKGMHRNLRNYSKCSKRFAWFWTQTFIRVITDSARIWYNLNCIILHLLFRTASCCVSRKVKDLIGRKYHQGRQILKNQTVLQSTKMHHSFFNCKKPFLMCMMCMTNTPPTRDRPFAALLPLGVVAHEVLPTGGAKSTEAAQIPWDCPIGIKLSL